MQDHDPILAAEEWATRLRALLSNDDTEWTDSFDRVDARHVADVLDQLRERATNAGAVQDEPGASVPTNCDPCGFPHHGPCDPDDLAAEAERRSA